MVPLMVTLFISAMVVANLAIAHFGAWATPFVAFVLVGFSLVSRDLLHDSWQRRRNFTWRMGSMIVVAGALAWAINPAAGRVAVASAVALVTSGIAETVTFTRLVDRPWMIRSNGSNVPGSVVDTVAFFAVAFGLSWALVPVMLTQIATKIGGGVVWSLVLRWTVHPDRRRARTAAV